MKIFVYGLSDDEEPYFKACQKYFGIEMGFCKQRPTLENAHLASGYPCISMLSTPCDAQLVDEFHKLGVSFISTRTIGYEHIDLNQCKKWGIRVGNATYGSESVADYTIMMMLMMLRKMKLVMRSYEIADYGFRGVLGSNLTNKTIGIIGTGAIGETIIKHLQGFDCHIIAWSRHQKKSLKELCEYVSLDELYRRSDIISLHLRANKDTYHFINDIAIDKMKDGVMIVNSARGSLIDNQALIKGLDSGKIKACALDVVEGEVGLYYNNRKGDLLLKHEMDILNGYMNVLMLPHLAFLTDDATKDMVYHSIESCICELKHQENPWLVLK